MQRRSVLALAVALVAAGSALASQEKPTSAFFTTSDGVKIH